MCIEENSKEGNTELRRLVSCLLHENHKIVNNFFILCTVISNMELVLLEMDREELESFPSKSCLIISETL